MVTEYDSQLEIVEGAIVSPEGIIGWVDYGRNYVYVCFYHNKMIVAECDSLDSEITHLVRDKIDEQYYYAFRILCTGEVTAVIRWTGDIVLVGVTSGYYQNGVRIWTPAKDLSNWPGLKEAG